MRGVEQASSPRERRRAVRYALEGASVSMRGETLPLLDLSTLGARAAGPHPSLRSNAVVPAVLLIPRATPDRPPRRFALLTMVLANDSRGVTLRFVQPSRLWVHKLAAYLETHANSAG